MSVSENYNFKKIERKLSKYLDEDRYQHTLGVMMTSACLAMAHGFEDIAKAQLAGLLHDCAKCIPNDKKLKICKKQNISVSAIEEENPFLLHAKLGVYIAKAKYDVADADVLEAIRYHTTGRAGMSDLEKIVYIADYIEPGRYKAAHLPYIRKIAFENLDLCMYEILKDTLEYLEKSPNNIDLETKEAYLFYKSKIETIYS
ncbi:MAG: bis(5'-nucleosyl)-tetraphosphatase (symmetrical) YqeK [Lachnospiraceae bacterium]|nr:bis(5'-nucleosyl)-tetraphosphatase (symmetrical) YqeK [Lachnospiraceae bacterium]MDD3617625.1 bis(5'-nucleosyl)-tetraphosphatase (symmetrical) YqeK [Lachnospiraceae bacterium]